MGKISVKTQYRNDTLFQRDLKSIISYSIPYIPMVGLVCGGIIIAKQWYMGKEDKEKDTNTHCMNDMVK